MCLMVIGVNSICMCLIGLLEQAVYVWLLEQTPIIYLNNIDQLMFAFQNVVFTRS